MFNTLLPVNNMLHRRAGKNGTVFCNYQYFMNVHLVCNLLPVLDTCSEYCYGRSIGNHCILMHDGHRQDILDWHAGTWINNMPVDKPTLAK